MFFGREGRALEILVLLTLVVLVAGCVSTPAPAPGGQMTPDAVSTAESSGALTGETASLVGAWEGAIKVGGQDLGITLNFSGEGGTIDIPAQGARGLRMENFSAQGNQVRFEMLPSPRTATFTGTVEGSQMGGVFSQAGYEGTWSATRGTGASASQPVSVAAGYKDEEVTFKNGQYTLAGTLSLPEGNGPHPAVVLISGSGAQNRDEEVFGFRPFAILADSLAKQGVAVLRYDDRGIGGSTTGTDDDTSETFAGDVSAAYDYLKTRSEIDSQKIGLLGHSEGGIIAPMVAVNKGDVAFVILLAGPGVPGKDVLVEQSRAVLEASGADQATVVEKTALQKRVVDAVLTGEGLDELQVDLVKEFKASAEALPADQRRQLGDVDQWAEQNVQAQLAAMQGPWMKFFLAHDPAPVLEKVKVPVLALFGGKDVQVPFATNEPAVRAALGAGGNSDVTIKVFADANHLFQAAETGSPDEYAVLAPEFAPEVLDTITGWIVERFE